MDTDEPTTVERLEERVKLDAEEKDYAALLSAQISHIRDLEANKAADVAEWNAQIKAVQAKLDRLNDEYMYGASQRELNFREQDDKDERAEAYEQCCSDYIQAFCLATGLNWDYRHYP